MVELEADDALAAAAAHAAALAETDRVFICSPDKDLAQCVRGDRVIQLDRRARRISDEAGVIAKFGVPPASIPDYLALVGDSADGFPGLAGWGARSAAAVLGRYGHIDAIPHDVAAWEVDVRGVGRLAAVLHSDYERALLFLDLATLRTDAPPFATLEELRWRGSKPAFAGVCVNLDAPELLDRVARLRP